MDKIDILPAIRQAEKTSQFLSDITGLPIVAVQAFPELATLEENKSDRSDGDFNYRLALGKSGDSYEVQVAVNLKND